MLLSMIFFSNTHKRNLPFRLGHSPNTNPATLCFYQSLLAGILRIDSHSNREGPGWGDQWTGGMCPEMLLKSSMTKLSSDSWASGKILPVNWFPIKDNVESLVSWANSVGIVPVSPWGFLLSVIASKLDNCPKRLERVPCSALTERLMLLKDLSKNSSSGICPLRLFLRSHRCL